MTGSADLVDEMSASEEVIALIENRGADTISLDQIGQGTENNISIYRFCVKILLAKERYSSRVKCISLMVLVSVFATIHGAIVKHLKHIAVGEVIFVAGIYSVCFFSMTLSFVGAPVINFPRKAFVFSRLFLESLAYIGKVWSLQHLPIGDATALFSTSPLFTGVIARIFI